MVANLSGFEKTHPDGTVVHSVLYPGTRVQNFKKAGQGPARYSGDVNSNPYAVGVTCCSNPVPTDLRFGPNGKRDPEGRRLRRQPLPRDDLAQLPRKVTTVAAPKDVLSLTFTRGALHAGTAAPAVLVEGATFSGPGGSIVRITFWTVGADPLPLSEISLGDQR